MTIFHAAQETILDSGWRRNTDFDPFIWSEHDFNCSYVDMEHELFKEFCLKQHEICNKREDKCTAIAGNECACHTSKAALRVNIFAPQIDRLTELLYPIVGTLL